MTEKQNFEAEDAEEVKILIEATHRMSDKIQREARALGINITIAKPDGLYSVAPDGTETLIEKGDYTPVIVNEKIITRRHGKK
jgi:predicted DNA-binding helix-hairpin-helix protein